MVNEWTTALAQALVFALVGVIGRYLWVLWRFSALRVLGHPFVLCSNKPVRFSASALLDCPSRQGDGAILVRSRASEHDDAYWSPLGGVIKYSTAADAELRKLSVVPARDPSEWDRFGRDLRVFVPGRHLLGLLSWFRRDQGREHFQTALQRELAEELIVSLPHPTDWSDEEWSAYRSEAGLALRYSQFDLAPRGRAMQMFKQNGMWHVRFFFVCTGHGDAFESLRMCIDRVEGEFIATVSRRAIDEGTFRGAPVGTHSQLLFADSVSRPHLPIADIPPG